MSARIGLRIGLTGATGHLEVGVALLLTDDDASSAADEGG